LFFTKSGLASVFAASEAGAESDKDEEENGADPNDDSRFLSTEKRSYNEHDSGSN